MSHMRKWKITPSEILKTGPVIPVMVIETLSHAVPLAKALLAGGIRVLEITLRTPVALDAIRTICREVPEALVGAGTVVTPHDLREVEEAGAIFAISPGLTPELLDTANRSSIAFIPGISTISESMTGMARGYEQFKFFPAEAAGGVNFLKSIAGPFPNVTFCPTGGISDENYRKYLALKNVACVGGSWVAPADAIRDNQWERITALAAKALRDAMQLDP